jgi:hypothetical protein
VRAILRRARAVITLVAIGRSNGTSRPTRTNSARSISALALKAANQTLLQSERWPRPCRRHRTRSRLPAGAYDLKDRENAAEVDSIAFAISVRLEGGLLIAEAERNDLQPAS